jgi:surface antigen
MLYRTIGKFPGWSGNAEDWSGNAKNLGWTVRAEPMPRSIVVMQQGGGTSHPLGHVAWVKSLEYRSDGYVYLHTRDMNWDGWSDEVHTYSSSMRFIVSP